jgi:hypothetical protein
MVLRSRLRGKLMSEYFTAEELAEDARLAKLYPMALCECGEVTLGGDDVSFPNGKTTFTPHKCA